MKKKNMKLYLCSKATPKAHNASWGESRGGVQPPSAGKLFKNGGIRCCLGASEV